MLLDSECMFVAGMATIIGKMANDHHRDGGHPWDRLEEFDHFWEGDLPMDGDHPKTIVLHRDGNPPRAGGCLRDFYLKIKTTSNKIENNIKIMMTSKKIKMKTTSRIVTTQCNTNISEYSNNSHQILYIRI